MMSTVAGAVAFDTTGGACLGSLVGDRCCRFAGTPERVRE